MYIQHFGKHSKKDNISIVASSQWKEVLLQSIPEDVLPVQWGGTNTDFEQARQMSPEFGGVKLGGIVPMYYQIVHRPYDIPGK